MRLAAVWVDDSVPADEDRPWNGPGHPELADRIAIVGQHAGPAVADRLAFETVSHLIVMTHPRSTDIARYFATVVGGALPALSVALVPLTVTPLAALVSASHTLMGGHGPTTSVALLKATASQVISGVWLKSVTRLGSPNPSFTQHLRSLFPRRAGYMALVSPRLEVLMNAETPLAKSSDQSVLVTTCEGTGFPSLIEDTFAGLPAYRLPSTVSIKDAFGSAGFEFMVDEGPAPAVMEMGTPCKACGEPRYTASCPYCHVISPNVTAA
ncbi:MAG: hypothetical protein ACK5LN_09465 [Propioniciclava sp.]